MSDASYVRLEVHYDQANRSDATDAACERAVGRPADDSGAGMGYRDLGWVFSDEATAEAARRRVLDQVSTVLASTRRVTR